MTEGKNNQFVYVAGSDYISPRATDEGQDKWVLWGLNNSFFKHLKELYLGSTTNGSCINGINKLGYGQGITMDNPSALAKLFAAMSTEDIERAFRQFYKLNKLTLQIDYDVKYETRGKGDEKIDVPVSREIKKVYFISAEKIGMGKKDDDGDILGYYYSEDWGSIRKAKNKPVLVPAFKLGDVGCESEIYYYQMELEGDDYFYPVLYHNCLQYAESEVELSNYHLNHILNGFAPDAIVNFNNGVPEEPIRQKIVKDFRATKTGSKNAGKAFITFNEGKENAVTVEAYNIPNPHKQYEFIDGLCEKKILLAHNVTSPLLFGIRDTTGGLGSNAKEIIEAYDLFDEMTLNPVRQAFLNGLKIIIRSLGIKDDPKFIPLAVFQKKDPVEQVATDAEKTDQAMKTAMFNLAEKKKPKSDVPVLSKEDENHWIESLKDVGEVIDSRLWDVVSITEAESNIEDENAFTELFLAEMPKDGTPQEKSKDGDSGLFKIRYRYGPDALKSNSRELCIFMVGRSNAGVIYKKEDIDYMSESGINSQFAERGKSTYDIFRFKGGCYCHHRWYRVIYFRKRNPNGTFMQPSDSEAMDNDKKVSIPQARKQGLPEDKLNTKDWPDAGTRPIDMPNRGKIN